MNICLPVISGVESETQVKGALVPDNKGAVKRHGHSDVWSSGKGQVTGKPRPAVCPYQGAQGSITCTDAPHHRFLSTRQPLLRALQKLGADKGCCAVLCLQGCFWYCLKRQLDMQTSPKPDLTNLTNVTSLVFALACKGALSTDASYELAGFETKYFVRPQTGRQTTRQTTTTAQHGKQHQ